MTWERMDTPPSYWSYVCMLQISILGIHLVLHMGPLSPIHSSSVSITEVDQVSDSQQVRI